MIIRELDTHGFLRWLLDASEEVVTPDPELTLLRNKEGKHVTSGNINNLLLLSFIGPDLQLCEGGLVRVFWEAVATR